MGSRGMLTLLLVLTHLIRKKDCFCKPYENRGGYRAADERHKNNAKITPLAIYRVCISFLSPNWAEFRPKTCFLASGLNNDFFAYMRKHRRRSAMR